MLSLYSLNILALCSSPPSTLELMNIGGIIFLFCNISTTSATTAFNIAAPMAVEDGAIFVEVHPPLTLHPRSCHNYQ